MYERYELLLKQRGVRTVDVCRATQISQQVMSTWKKRRGGISTKNAAKIANYFGVSVDYLMGETDDPTPQDDYYIHGETAKLAQEMYDDPDVKAFFHMKRTMAPDVFSSHFRFMKEAYRREHPEDDTGC